MRNSISRAVVAVLVLVMLNVTVSSASGGVKHRSAAGQAIVNGGTARYAEPVGHPDWILPFQPPAELTYANGQFIPLMWRSIYDVGSKGRFALEEDISIAEPLILSKNGKTATIRLKPWRWSDGKPITTRDMTFMFNLYKANKDAIGGYVPGLFPDNVKSFRAVNSRTLKITFTTRYAADWLTYNQLAGLGPVPQHAWDKTSVHGKVGNYDRTTAGAKAVYNFLISQSNDRTTYATNPLWRVVDGPWLLKKYTLDGYAEFVPNKRYSGPYKPHLATFQELPFTSSDAEVNSLRAGGIDVGGLPNVDLSQLPSFLKAGFISRHFDVWGFNYMQINFNNPDVGMLFKQLYVRQALESVVDQTTMLLGVDKGQHYYYGPVPQLPKNPFYSSEEKKNWLNYSPKRAVRLLRAHGWSVKPGGTSSCTKPGTRANQCGAHIPRGAQLKFNLISLSGCPGCDQEVQLFQTDASKVGIAISISTAPFNTVYGETRRCQPSDSSCSWQISYYTGWGYGPVVPSGENLFACNGADNYGSFCDPGLDKLIKKTVLAGGPKAYASYEARVSHDVPELWLPGGTFGHTLIKKKLHGVYPFSPVELIYPERWYWTK
jgi:peptide/nickel transport system substrate-binding protein